MKTVAAAVGSVRPLHGSNLPHSCCQKTPLPSPQVAASRTSFILPLPPPEADMPRSAHTSAPYDKEYCKKFSSAGFEPATWGGLTPYVGDRSTTIPRSTPEL